MTIGLPSPLQPSPRTLCQQVGRWLAALATLPGGTEIVFAEDGDDASGAHVFAREMPPRRFRHASGAGLSITVASEQPPEGTDPTTKIFLAFEARANVRRDAESLLREVFRVLVMPGGHPWHMPPLTHAGTTVMTGVVGPPPPEGIDAGNGAAVWRVLAVEATQPVTPTAVEASALATEEGQGAAECTLAFTVVPHSISLPLAAATLFHDGSGGVDAAQVRARATIRTVAGVVRTAALALEYRTSTDGGETWAAGSLDAADYANLADLVAALPAGWSTAPGAASARIPYEMAYFPWGDALLIANERTLRAWA